MTDYEINGKEYEVEYDLDNRIIKVEVNNSDVEYRYDAFGRRIIRQEGSTKSALIWWGNSECAEHKHQAGQTVIQNDIMAHPSRLNSVIARAKDGSKFKLEWYHKNYPAFSGLAELANKTATEGSPATAGTGDILEHYRYTAFGEVTIYDENGAQVATTQIDNHILWNTRRRDEVTGYYMYKFRHYSPHLGRWPSRDPIEESGGINLYGFVNNQPIYYRDSLGLAIIPPNPFTDPFTELDPPTIGQAVILSKMYDDPSLTDGKLGFNTSVLHQFPWAEAVQRVKHRLRFQFIGEEIKEEEYYITDYWNLGTMLANQADPALRIDNYVSVADTWSSEFPGMEDKLCFVEVHGEVSPESLK